MNLIKEVTLTIFSLILMVLAIVCSAVILGWIDLNFIETLCEGLLLSSKITTFLLIVNALIVLFALIAIFGNSSKKQSKKSGVLLENEKGKLLISKETLENLVNGVLKGFDNVNMNAIKTELDEESKLNVNVSISVGENVVIKDISNAIQNQVKETIKKASDLEVKNVNISIRGIIEDKKDNIK